MQFSSSRMPYRQTGAFSKIVLDYIDQAAGLRPFFKHPPSLQGIREAIEERKKNPFNRAALVEALRTQYGPLALHDKEAENLAKLASPNTFTVVTAHQCNLFTGPLYVIYKILHAIRLSAYLKESFTGYDFVPVFFMGSEDADLPELNHIYLEDQKMQWETNQQGAVGRMLVDAKLLKLISQLEGRLNVLPHGKPISVILQEAYRKGRSIQDASLHFLHEVFGSYGLLVLIPDNPAFKKLMQPVFEAELLRQESSAIVEETSARLGLAGYGTQARPREINLFYLDDGSRERIEKTGEDLWKVVNREISFSKDELLAELQGHPEKFSPNVILRGIYQESILPNIAFIGGGGEIAYWLQLKDLFAYHKVPFPVLVLRNSYLLADAPSRERLAKLGLPPEDLFLGEEKLVERLAVEARGAVLRLNGSLRELEKLYEGFKKQAVAVDPTLEKHVDALRAQSLEKLTTLEKKMLRAEKRKFSDQRRQIRTLLEKLFPSGELQERHQNFLLFYAKWGREFLDALLENAGAMEQEFCVLLEIDSTQID
jgi:bacillithiol biosynthesis cysteine-adding enzyme BshC